MDVGSLAKNDFEMPCENLRINGLYAYIVYACVYQFTGYKILNYRK